MPSIFTRSARALVAAIAAVAGLPPPASAWKVDLHIWIAQQVLDDARDGSITIDFAGTSRSIALPTQVVRALNREPKQFLLGALGPDAFPDVVAGQMVIHPSVAGGWGTSEWLQHLRNGARTDAEIAFAMGYLTHASGDIFAHTFVNRYTGDVFEILNHPSAATRHVYIESLVSSYLPPLRLIANATPIKAADAIRTGGRIEFPEALVRERLLMDETAIKQLRLSGSAPHLVGAYDLYHSLDGFLADDGTLQSIEAIVAQILAKIYLEIDLSNRDANELVKLTNRINTELNQLAPDLVKIAQDANGALHELEGKNFDAAAAALDLAVRLENELQSARAKLREAQDAVVGATDQLADLERRGIREILKVIGRVCMGQYVHPTPWSGEGCIGYWQDVTETEIPGPLATARAAHAAQTQLVRTLEAQVDKLKPGATDAIRKGLDLAREAHETRKRAIDSLVAFLGDKPFSAPHRQFFERWRDGIPVALVEFTRANATAIANSIDPDAPSALQPMKDWLICYGPVFLSAPVSATEAGCKLWGDIQQLRARWNEFEKSVAQFDPVLSEILNLKQRLETEIEKVKENALDTAVEEGLKSFDRVANSQLFPLYKGVTEKITVGDVNSIMSSDASGQGLPLIPDAGDRILAELALKDGKLDPAKFAPIYDSVVLAKLALLDRAGLQQLAAYGGVTDSRFGRGLYNDATPYSSNILYGFIRSIDGNHQWQVLSPPHPRNHASGIEAEDFAARSSSMDTRYSMSDTRCPSVLGMRLWVDPGAREKIFTKIFKGHVVRGVDAPEALPPGFGRALPANYPNLFDPGAVFERDGITLIGGATLSLSGTGAKNGNYRVEAYGNVIARGKFDGEGRAATTFSVGPEVLPGEIVVFSDVADRVELATVFQAGCDGADPLTFTNAPASILVTRGMSLWDISKATSSSADNYPALYEANTGKIVDPDLIFPGQRLKLPWSPTLTLSSSRSPE